MNEETKTGAASDDERKIARPQKIYLKDVSFEAPNTPDIFTLDWEPSLGVEIDTATQNIDDDAYEVVMKVTVTVSVGEITAFLAEVHQAGIFTFKGFDSEQLERLFSVFCPRTLYPYASAALTDIVSKGGFPQLLLAPINFEAQYQLRLQQAQATETDQASQ